MSAMKLPLGNIHKSWIDACPFEGVDGLVA
jgi:hypothetical protein